MRIYKAHLDPEERRGKLTTGKTTVDGSTVTTLLEVREGSELPGFKVEKQRKVLQVGDEKCSGRVDIWLHGAMIDGWIFVGTQTEGAFLIFSSSYQKSACVQLCQSCYYINSVILLRSVTDLSQLTCK